MARSKTLMSENLKEEIAKELGVYEKVKQEHKKLEESTNHDPNSK